MLVHRRVTPSSVLPVPMYTPHSGWKETMWSEVSCLEERTRRQLELGSTHWPLDLTFDALNTIPTHPDLCFRRLGKSNDRLEFSCWKNVVGPVLVEPPRNPQAHYFLFVWWRLSFKLLNKPFKIKGDGSLVRAQSTTQMGEPVVRFKPLLLLQGFLNLIFDLFCLIKSPFCRQ